MNQFFKQSLQLVFAFIFLTTICQAQQKFFYHTPKKAPIVSNISGQGTNVDVVYQRCTWRIHPDSPTATAPAKYLRGNVTTYFVTKQDNTASITFDFI